MGKPTKLFLSLFLLFFFSTASAIVIIPPVVYVVTLSIATFIGNTIILLMGWLAISGVASKKVFGKKLSEAIAFFFSGIKKAFIAIVSLLASVLLVKPIEIFSILEGAIVSLLVCLALLFFSNYSEFRIVEKSRKTSLLKSAGFFSIIVLLVFAFSSAVSIETKIILPDQKTGGLGAETAAKSVGGAFWGSSIGRSSPADSGAVPSETAKKGAEGSSKPGAIGKQDKIFVGDIIWFYPQNSGNCIVQIGAQNFSLAPKFDCYFLENGAPKRIFCPISVSIGEINQADLLDVHATGSCDFNGKIFVENGFWVNG